MPQGIRLAARPTVHSGAVRVFAALLTLTLWILPAAGFAQVQDARQPEPGELWFSVGPGFENWSDQFAKDSPRALSDGDSEPLASDFDGPIVSRLFPGVDPLVADLNADANALGFDSLSAGGLSLGDLDFGTINVMVRRVHIGLELGLSDRLSFEAGAPLVFTEVEPRFAFDSVRANVSAASSAIPDPMAFFGQFEAAVGSLSDLVGSGSLNPAEQAAATALLQDSGAFLAALQRRVMTNGLLPLATSPAGAQITDRFGSLADGFTALGLSLPAFALADLATSADLAAFFGSPFVSAAVPGVTERNWTVGEAEAGLRYRVFNGPLPGHGSGGLVQLRTTLGGKVRFPLRQADRPPFSDPDNFFDQPIGDGQTDVELALYQDVEVGSGLLVNLVARYGIQLSDQLQLRVAPPDRPFALVSTRALVERNLGDYLSVRVAPQVRLNRFLSIGVEYGFWHKGNDTYRLIQSGSGITDARPLEVETRQTRQRLGLGLFYRTGQLVPRRSDGTPWQIAALFQSAISGSGGQTPVSQLFTFSVRAPLRLVP
ncbi:MAG: hypothetical protein ACE5HQ_00205 [Gemmatimonadota bacterium]